jgi:hypothetical protein
MVAVDVDDEHTVQITLICLAPRVGKQPGGVKLLNRNPSAAIGNILKSSPPPAHLCPATMTYAATRNQ